MTKFPFSKELFWDAEIEDINLKKNRRYVVERVITRGRMQDFRVLLSLYTTEDIKSAIRHSKELDPKTRHFCSWYFDIPQNELHASSFYR